MQIESVVAFTEFLGKLSAIKRMAKLKSRGDFENDAEHSFQVALVSWHIADALNLPLDAGLILKYGLVHDLVEAYAGDTDPFISPKEFIASKDSREESARLQIQKEFPEFSSLHKTIERYKTLSDEESRLVHLVDKMLADINTLLANDPYYRNYKVTREAWREWIDGKIRKAKVADNNLSKLVEAFLSYVEGQAEFYPSV